MKNPLVLLLRHIALRRNESKAPHSLRPLCTIRQATVLIAPHQEDSDAVKAAVRQYFSYNNIPAVNILSPDKGELDLAGTIRKKSRGDRLPEDSSELLISLAGPEDGFWPEYEARCSNACFKIGRSQLKGGVFDLVILPPENGNIPSQSAVFAEIKNYLNIIR